MARSAPRRERAARGPAPTARRPARAAPPAAGSPARRPLRPALVVAFFLGGAAALVHEVVWARLLVALVGAAAHAQAAVLAVTMGGLALGAVLFGRRADRTPAPLRTYVRLELAIAAYGVLLPLVVTVAEAAYVPLGRRVFESAEAKLALRFALTLGTILLPAVLMGGTLPVLARHVVRHLAHTQAAVGRLYAANTFGAVLGVALGGFVTLPAAGVHGSLAAAVALNLAAAWLAARAGDVAPAGAAGVPPSAPAAAPAAPAYPPAVYRLTLGALAASGFAAMGYEVVFTRLIALAFGSSAYSFTVMLVAFIAGLGVGAWAAGRRPATRPLWLLGTTQLAAVAALLATTPFVERLPWYATRLRVALVDVPGGFGWLLAAETLLCVAFLLAPTACLGLAFPLVAAVQARQPARLGAQVGTTYAWNTAGNVLGAIGTTLVLVPALGVRTTFHVLVGATALAGVALLAAAREAPAARRALAVAATAAVALVYGARGTGWTDALVLARNHLRLREAPPAGAPPAVRAGHPATSFAAWRRNFVERSPDETVFHVAEDAHATVLAVGDEDAVYLIVDGKTDASTDADLPTQLLLAHVPLFLAPRTDQVLIVGHGSGITAGAALRHPVRRADVVELSPGVLRVDGAFAAANHHVLADPRVHVYVDDAQSFLRTVPRQYDVVISEPTNPWIAGVGDLFTREYYESVRRALVPGGLAVLWFHEYDLDDDAVALVLRTVRAAFPHVLLFRVFGWGDVFAVASAEPFVPDFDAMERRWEVAAVRDDLGRIETPNLAALLSHHSIPARALDGLAGAGPVNTMAHERLAYAAPRTSFTHAIARRLGAADAFLEPGADRGDDDLLLDRYAAFRAAVGEPISREELAAAARYHRLYAGGQPTAAPALERRAAAAGVRGTTSRPARVALRSDRSLSPLARVARARRLAEAGRHAKAIPLLERARAADPDDLGVVFALARSLQAVGRADDAVAVLEPMAARHPDHFRLARALAWAYLHAGRRAEALAAHRAVAARWLQPDSFGAIGALLVEDGRPAEAIPYFERALELDPTYWQPAAGLVGVLATDPATRPRARRILEDALRVHPAEPDLLRLREQLAGAPR